MECFAKKTKRCRSLTAFQKRFLITVLLNATTFMLLYQNIRDKFPFIDQLNPFNIPNSFYKNFKNSQKMGMFECLVKHRELAKTLYFADPKFSRKHIRHCEQ